MSEIIYKYGPLSTNGETIEFNGTPVHVGYQDIGFAHASYEVFIWCRLEYGYNNSSSKAKIVATGEEYTGRYIGTVVMPSGLVWHVVEV
jgi:hypothetical protein